MNISTQHLAENNTFLQAQTRDFRFQPADSQVMIELKDKDAAIALCDNLIKTKYKADWPGAYVMINVKTKKCHLLINISEHELPTRKQAKHIYAGYKVISPIKALGLTNLINNHPEMFDAGIVTSEAKYIKNR